MFVNIGYLAANCGLVSISALHRLCVVQLDRLETKDAKTAKRILAGIFWDDVDERIKALGIGSGRNLTRGKRELVGQFYGLCYAYEEGLRLLPDRTKLQSSLLR